MSEPPVKETIAFDEHAPEILTPFNVAAMAPPRFSLSVEPLALIADVASAHNEGNDTPVDGGVAAWGCSSPPCRVPTSETRGVRAR